VMEVASLALHPLMVAFEQSHRRATAMADPTVPPR
jgi:hypothetical protein